MKRSRIAQVSKKKRAEKVLENTTRKIVMERASGMCEACAVRGWRPVRRANDKHERIMRSMGGDPLDPDNCLAVCRDCHAWLHSHPVEATKLGLLKSNHKAFGFRLYDERTCETNGGE